MFEPTADEIDEMAREFGLHPLAIATMVVVDIYLYVRFKKTRWL